MIKVQFTELNAWQYDKPATRFACLCGDHALSPNCLRLTDGETGRDRAHREDRIWSQTDQSLGTHPNTP